MNNITALNNNDLELADIFNLHKHKLHFLNNDEFKAVNAITSCRTAKLGGHVLNCDNCSYIEISYNSCRNRHCPKCQFLLKARWTLERDTELLPVHYFHMVFTIPSLFNSLLLCNKKLIYKILFRSVSETIKQVAENPKNLGAYTGFFAILHTWDQQLRLHPHIHCIVPGGGFSKDKSRWIKSPKNFFLSVKKLSIVFRAKFISYLENTFDSDKLTFPKHIAILNNQKQFKNFLIKSCSKNWVVYSKPPFNGAFGVLRYLGSYIHRIAISNNRLIAMTDDSVTFKWKDRKNNNATKTLKLDALLFIKRFLYHVLPSGFMKIRHYGFIGNAHRKKNILLARKLLNVPNNESTNQKDIPCDFKNLMILLTGKDPTICPKCNKGHLFVKYEIDSYFSKQHKYIKAG